MIVDAHAHLFPPAQARDRMAIAARDAGFAAIYADPRAAMAGAPELLALL